MSFFYDLNKRLSQLAAKQDAKQLAESAQAEAVAQSPLTQALNESAVAEAGYSAKAGRAGKDLGKPGKNFAKIAKGAAERYGSKEAGERVAGAVLNKLRHPTNEGTCPSCDCSPCKCDSMEESALQAYLGNKKYGKEGMNALRKAGREHAGKAKMDQIRNRYDKMDEADMEEGNAFTGALAKTPKGGKFKVGDKEFTDTSSIEEADIVGLEAAMTPKQKSFAKLAPPTDKITFADKIAGAKKEVDEMLGDVAAEAIKGAIGKKKEPRSKGTAFDADFMKQQQVKKDAESHSRYDVQDTGYSKRYTRKAVDTDIDTDDEVKSDAPKKKGRPKGADKGPERVTKGSYKYKSGRPAKTDEDLDTDGVMMTRPSNMSSEGVDHGEYDREGDMAKEQMHTIMSAAKELHRILKDEENLPEWVQKKITLAKEYIDTARDYMLSQHAESAEEEPIAEKAKSKAQQKFMGMVHAAQKGEKPASKEVGKVAKSMGKKDARDFASTKHKGLPAHVEEESTNKEDNKAEKAGKKVAKDIEHDEGHKGKDDNKAEKAGKKVTKDIEYDDKKDKEEKVKESNKGGYNFGGGVYENLDKKVENMIAEGMSVNISIDEQGKKSISVNATDEDAEALAQLLKMAGLEGQSNDQQGCASCGQAPCGCAEIVDENQPDWPTNTETSDDAFQYSGGLNKPKSTGQTTIPVIASQLRRQVSMEENVELERSLFKTWKNYKG
jgi:hypothetical protein